MDIGHHAQFAEARNIDGINALHMGQLVEAGPRAIGGAGRFKGIEGGAHRAIADDVNMDLEAGSVEGGEEFLDLVMAEHEFGVAAKRVGIGFDHHAGAVFQNAIEEEFRRVNLEQVGAGIAAQIFDTAERIFGFLGGDNLGSGGDAHGQVAGAFQTAVNPGVALVHHGIDDAGYAVAVAQGLPVAHAIGVILVGWYGHEALGPVGCGFMQHACGLAVGTQNEVAVFGIGRAAHEAHRLAAFGIQAGVVSIAGHDVAGPVRNGGIEHLAVEIMIGENAGVPADAIHPGAGMGLGEVGQDFLQFGDGGDVVKGSAFAVIIAAVLQMDVGVLKAGQDEVATGIDDASSGAGKRRDLGGGADGGDAPVDDSQGSNARGERIHGADIGVGDNEFRGFQDGFSSVGQSGEGMIFAGWLASRVQQKIARKGASPVMVAWGSHGLFQTGSSASFQTSGSPGLKRQPWGPVSGA